MFAAADVGILSYTRDFIGASGVLTHACGFALPVIASDVGQLGELVREHGLGLTFTPEDALSLRQVIAAFFSLPLEGRQAFAARMAAFTAANSWEEIARKHLALYGLPRGSARQMGA